MSIESAKAFLERMKTDEDFAKKVTECKDAEARMALVKTEGFEFTQQDMQQLKAKMTDDELEAVAGGAPVACNFKELWIFC